MQRRMPLFLFPELGTNCDLCYREFLSDEQTDFLRQNFLFYSVEIVPPNVDNHANNTSGEEDDDDDDDEAYEYTYESLVDDLNVIVSNHRTEFCIDHNNNEKEVTIMDDAHSGPIFHGMGTGMGGYLLSLFACHHPHMVASMILISSPIHGASWGESIRAHVKRWIMPTVSVESISNQLLHTYFADSFVNSGGNHGHVLNEFREHHRQRLPPSRLKHDLELSLKRRDLNQSLLRRLTCPVLLLVGEHSTCFDDVSYNLDMFNPECVSYVKVEHCGGLVTREKPEEILVSLKLFLQSLSFLLHTVVQVHHHSDHPLSIKVL